MCQRSTRFYRLTEKVQQKNRGESDGCVDCYAEIERGVNVELLVGLLGAALMLLVLWDAFETIILPRRVTRRLRLARLFLSVYLASVFGTGVFTVVTKAKRRLL